MQTSLNLNLFIEKYCCEDSEYDIRFSDADICLNQFVGRGSYNIVFFAKYNNKASIFKFFAPLKYKNDKEQFDFSYEVLISICDKKIVIDSIRVPPSQIWQYNDLREKYNASNNKILELLGDKSINFVIPKPYNESIVYDGIISEDGIINRSYIVFAYDGIDNLEHLFRNSDDICKKLSIVQSLAGVLQTLYASESHLLMLDIKPENFYYLINEEAKICECRILDWDSILEYGENGVSQEQIIHSSKGYRPFEVEKANNYFKAISSNSCVYMLGACLYQALILSYDKDTYPFPCPAHEFSDVEFSLDLKRFADCFGLTGGFLNRFISIMNKSYTNYIPNRYSDSDGSTAFQKFSKEIEVLIEIYQNHGVHPEVMLEKAFEIATGMSFDFDNNLCSEVCEVKDVSEEQ